MKIYRIIRIDPVKRNSRGQEYRRIVFRPDDYNESKTVLFCDVVKGFDNEKRWRPIIERGKGTLVTNVKERDSKHIDADSYPQIAVKKTGEVYMSVAQPGSR